ncbi:MAG: hypothetical protein HY720_32875 [Planctomycetes bacterium]|nr:hypothetical protein [Planctomycetota bacterium]
MKHLAIVLLPLAALVSCSDRQPLPEEAGYDAVNMPIPSYSEYKLAWQSLEEVMKKHFLIRVSRYEDGLIVATSQINADQGMKQRLYIVGRIVEDKDGFFEPEIYVKEQIDMSDVKPHMPPAYTPAYQWRDIGRNEAAEAALVEEVLVAMRGGRMNPQDGAFFQIEHPGEMQPAPAPAPEGETPRQ